MHFNEEPHAYNANLAHTLAAAGLARGTHMNNTEDAPSFEHHRNQCTELRADEVGRCHSRHFAIYTAVDPADNIHRPMPPQHPALLGEEEFRKLIVGIDLETAAVQWACRSLPLPANAYPDLECFVVFVEAAPGMWVRFDDLPEELAKALLDKNLYYLIERPIQRPFDAEELAELVAEIRQMDPATAVCCWHYAEDCDPYGFGNVPHVLVGKVGFVKASGDRWVWFGDLPAEIGDRIYEARARARVSSKTRNPVG